MKRCSPHQHTRSGPARQLVGEDGRLLGIGSLLVQETVDGETVQGNMMVPIDPARADSR